VVGGLLHERLVDAHAAQLHDGHRGGGHDAVQADGRGAQQRGHDQALRQRQPLAPAQEQGVQHAAARGPAPQLLAREVQPLLGCGVGHGSW
jgi:hypothetical protein